MNSLFIKDIAREESMVVRTLHFENILAEAYLGKLGRDERISEKIRTPPPKKHPGYAPVFCLRPCFLPQKQAVNLKILLYFNKCAPHFKLKVSQHKR